MADIVDFKTKEQTTTDKPVEPWQPKLVEDVGSTDFEQLVVIGRVKDTNNINMYFGGADGPNIMWLLQTAITRIMSKAYD